MKFALILSFLFLSIQTSEAGEKHGVERYANCKVYNEANLVKSSIALSKKACRSVCEQSDLSKKLKCNFTDELAQTDGICELKTKKNDEVFSIDVENIAECRIHCASESIEFDLNKAKCSLNGEHL